MIKLFSDNQSYPRTKPQLLRGIEKEKKKNTNTQQSKSLNVLKNYQGLKKVGKCHIYGDKSINR